MIISRTQHRISFFGRGTDYPSYYLEHGGKVLGAAIEKYLHILFKFDFDSSKIIVDEPTIMTKTPGGYK